MLKINLSDREGSSREKQNLEEIIGDEGLEESVESEVFEDSASEKVIPERSEMMADMLGDAEKPKKPEKPAGKSGNIIMMVVLGIIVIAVAAVIFTQKNRLISLFAKKTEVSSPLPLPPPPAPEPVPEPVRTELDPTFVALSRISEIIPPRVWLSSATISSDGTYEIRGMSFSHDALGVFTSSLGSIGQVTDQDIPAKRTSSETVYYFSIAGGLTNITPPEILDIIPSDDLVATAEPVIKMSDDFGVVFKSVPVAGKTYTEQDLPFMLEGSFEGLKQVIGELCPQDGQIRVHRLVIKPASGSRMFDRVQASFSLRTTSSI